MAKPKLIGGISACFVIFLFAFFNLHSRSTSLANLPAEYILKSDYSAYQTDSKLLQTRPCELIVLKHGVAKSHQVKNGHLAIYQTKNQAFYLKKGEQLSFLFHIDPVLPNGHHASIGYILDDQYQVFARGGLKEQAYAEFEAPEDGEYKFFLWCTATDTIHVSSLTIK
ncbi:hypothetical protein [Marasmitruncus massiliensis]|uniref:hypothetical protein n=1 Tax=Marasmitruncus massiliensis TaxID=1944642 RepID=UPI000C79DEC8|nr:hypothetical protein [Marasmitruncus massiliensis]